MDHYHTEKYICGKCMNSFESSYVYCPNCGKRFRKQKTVKKKYFVLIFFLIGMLLCVLLAVGYLFVRKARWEETRDNAFEAMYNQDFSKAKMYMDQYPDAKTKFAEEYAYIEAGIFMEQGEYYKALKAFERQRLPVSEEINQALKQGSYFEAVRLYRDGSAGQAKEIFAELDGYRLSNDYLVLIKCKRGNQTSYYNELIDLIDVEDAKEIIIKNNIYAERFLTGIWKTYDKSHYFKMNSKGRIDSNIPKIGYDKSYILKNGVYYSINGDGDNMECYKFRITGKNSLVIFCYKDGQSYYLFRE